MLCVRQGTVQILETNGRFDRVLEPGWHFYVPILSEIKMVRWSFPVGGYMKNQPRHEIPMNHIVIDMESYEMFSKGGDVVQVDPDMTIRIVDPKKFVYEHGDSIFDYIIKEVEESIRSVCREYSTEELLHNEKIIENAVRMNLDNKSLEDALGFVFEKFVIESIRGNERRTELDAQRDLNTREHVAKMERQQQESEYERAKIETETLRTELEGALRAKRALAEQQVLNVEKEQANKRLKEEVMAQTEARLHDYAAMMTFFNNYYGDEGPERFMEYLRLQAMEQFSENTHFVSPGTFLGHASLMQK